MTVKYFSFLNSNSKVGLDTISVLIYQNRQLCHQVIRPKRNIYIDYSCRFQNVQFWHISAFGLMFNPHPEGLT